MKIATWNINSVRLRAGLVQRLIKDEDPDIICLQETKTPDEFFPGEAFAAHGYAHMHFHGMKGYNGVAVLSRVPFASKEIYHRAGKQDCRHIAVCVKSGKFKTPVELHCLYIPAGGDEPDPKINEKFDHKLKFVDEMAKWFGKNYKSNAPLIALGDFNIAPLEHDVWSHKQLLSVVSHTPVEVEKLGKMQKSLDWLDVSRNFVPHDQKCYTWWSYRNRDWKKSDRGRRLDHIWVTKPLEKFLKGQKILKAARDWKQPSDHVPLLAEISL